MERSCVRPLAVTAYGVVMYQSAECCEGEQKEDELTGQVRYAVCTYGNRIVSGLTAFASHKRLVI